MDIRNTKELRSFAAQRLSQAPDAKRIVAIYGGVTLGLAALLTAVNYVLGLRISQTGGLSNMGARSVLSALQTMLPLVQSLVGMCLDVGYIAAMLRIARGQYTSPNTLRLGFDRFWVLLRCGIIRGLIYCAIAIAGVYLSVMIYLLTPLSQSAMEILTPLVSQTTLLDSGLVLDDATYSQLISAMTPAFILCAVVCTALAAPILYNYRMVNYVIIDRPGTGAFAALRESRKMMRGNRMKLLKLDLGMWWYYAALVVASVVCYGDMILPLLGISLPCSEDVAYFLFFALYLAVQFAAYYFLRNRVEVTYGLAYDAVKPEEKKDNSVVLGNIFQM